MVQVVVLVIPSRRKYTVSSGHDTLRELVFVIALGLLFLDVSVIVAHSVVIRVILLGLEREKKESVVLCL